MSCTNLHEIVQKVVCRARRQGYVVPREIREELALADRPDAHWKEVIGLARPQLNFRQGRYYYVPAVRANMLQGQRHQQFLQRAIRRLVREHKLAADHREERRRQGRVQFVHPVTVHTADNRVLRFLSRDISVSGLCLIGHCNLQGQRVRVQVPGANPGEPALGFRVQILWALEVGDHLWENGGIFLKLVSEEGSAGKS